MCERLKSLHLLRQIRKRRCHSRLELFGRFCVSPLPDLVLASCYEESLFGTEATLLNGGADLFSQFSGRVSKTSWNGLSTHKFPLSGEVPPRYHELTNLVPRKRQGA
ncbi:MAG: hypothetical protein DMG76_31925 [Acidobacteria bacterium]|nr:MAG: hypothetical protein DMG76_31925 [Acidobacteriota bacterium]